MKIKYIIVAILFLYLSSCISNKSKTDKIIQLKHYDEGYDEQADSSYEYVDEIDTVFLEKLELNNTSTYTYKLDNESTILTFTKAINSDSLINIYGFECVLVAEKEYQIGNRKLKVLKYYYDEEFACDEETSFFFNQEYGILLGFNNGWMDLLYSLEYDDISRILVDTILNDWYFLKSIPLVNGIPPPPPPDSLLKMFE